MQNERACEESLLLQHVVPIIEPQNRPKESASPEEPEHVIRLEPVARGEPVIRIYRQQFRAILLPECGSASLPHLKFPSPTPRRNPFRTILPDAPHRRRRQSERQPGHPMDNRQRSPKKSLIPQIRLIERMPKRKRRTDRVELFVDGDSEFAANKCDYGGDSRGNEKHHKKRAKLCLAIVNTDRRQKQSKRE